MNARLNAVLAYSGLGGLFGFLVVFFGYAASRDYMAYSILLGAAVGVVLGMYLGPAGFRVAPAASLMGGGFHCRARTFLGLWGRSEKL
ncbi:hypothetical membrane protein [Thermococcus kodakarensis KOD1]|uniref:Hypothetical membrane protein n=1 Tax=Thermococcus kodakarensis (strain ATCC BAA-918 / JCM 12380 / KOD1) TaxID=69014 RepID=Q5JGP0_THEKO|nr:hypothetical protein [Thermococcus kodakarensis]WCN27269.1 hypothetical protein POG15_06455 [Thermococcus kodakarensis]BAD85460.1 hypothetical membrane protein [Thermococcus kodakarensis KOD1]